jgi:hypothetical protein
MMFDWGAKIAELNKLWAVMSEKAKAVTQRDLNALLSIDKAY